MHAKCWSAINIFQQAYGILEKACWQFQVQQCTVTNHHRANGNYLFRTTLNLQGKKKKQKKNQQLLMQIWKEKIKSWAEKCSELLPLSGLQNGVMNKDTSESSGYAFIQTLLHHPGWQEGQKHPNYYQHWDKWLCEELCQMWAGSCICACASQIPMALEIICFV